MVSNRFVKSQDFHKFKFQPSMQLILVESALGACCTFTSFNLKFLKQNMSRRHRPLNVESAVSLLLTGNTGAATRRCSNTTSTPRFRPSEEELQQLPLRCNSHTSTFDRIINTFRKASKCTEFNIKTRSFTPRYFVVTT